MFEEVFKYMYLGISDQEFIRGTVPMTKQEVRILSVAKLQLDENSIVYDVGAGTGSVSVEIAMQCKNGMVYSIEKNEEALSLIAANKEKFHLENIKIIKGIAPDSLKDLPIPTHVFIGGSSGNLIDIIRIIRKKNEKVRFVMNAVTLETVSQLEEVRVLSSEYEEMEVIQVGISRSKKLGKYHLMQAENPVYVVSFGGNVE